MFITGTIVNIAEKERNAEGRNEEEKRKNEDAKKGVGIMLISTK